jgi:hypothetical protein
LYHVEDGNNELLLGRVLYYPRGEREARTLLEFWNCLELGTQEHSRTVSRLFDAHFDYADGAVNIISQQKKTQ